MLGSAIAETAVGIIFIYILLSIAGTASVEAFGAVINWRGRHLKKWLEIVLGKENAKAFYDSSTIKAQSHQSSFAWLAYPSYISDVTFADTLTQFVAGDRTADLTGIQNGLNEDRFDGTVLRPVLSILIQKANGNYGTFVDELKKWFNDSQDRVTGWFKVQSTVALIIAGFLVAFLANIDTVQIGEHLYQAASTPNQAASTGTNKPNTPAPQPKSNSKPQNAATTSASKPAKATQANPPGNKKKSNNEKKANDEKQLDEVTGIVGWGNTECWKYWGNWKSHPTDCLTKLFGMFLTTLAISLGAPYWFEVLNKMNETIRATGTKPIATKETK